jgi:hypothetical protein
MPCLFFFLILDERRMKIVEIGGAQELLIMLEAAKEDRTRKAALKALAALSQSGYIKMFAFIGLYFIFLFLMDLRY